MTTLATVRSDLYDALNDADLGAVYRTRQTNYDFPAIVVGWPQSMDVRPAMGTPRDFVIDVHIGVEVHDADGADELLSILLEAAVVALQDNKAWDVQPITDFGEDITSDQRVLLWCRLPVAVFA